MMEDLPHELSAKTLNAVAAGVRPFLADYASALDLPRGILGAAFLRTLETTEAIVFAENVVAERTVERVMDEQQQEKWVRSVHYTWPRYHPFVDCIASPSEPCVLLSRKARATAGGREQDDIWGPLQRLFHGDVPEAVTIHRAWLREDHAVLYFIPEDQDGVPEQWNVLFNIRHIIGKGLRWPLIALTMHDRMVQARPEIDAGLIAQMLTCLPEHLERFERELIDASSRHRQFEELATELLVSWDRYKKEIRIEACRGASQIPVTIIKPRVEHGCKNRARGWTNGDGNTSKHLWIIGNLALRHVFAELARKLQLEAEDEQPSRVRSKSAFSKEMPQRCLYSLVYEGDALTASKSSDKQDRLPQEFLRDEGPTGEVKRGRSVEDDKVDKLEKAVRDAHKHLCQRILRINSKGNRLIWWKWLNHEKHYYLNLPVKWDESIRLPLAPLRHIFDYASPAPEHWPCQLFYEILSDG